MPQALPPRARLDWLRKTARQKLTALRTHRPDLKLAEVQLMLAREYGFSSWRSLKAHVEALQAQSSVQSEGASEQEIAEFLRAVGTGNMPLARTRLQAKRELLNATGPHPFWNGRPQALHVAIESARKDMFDLLLASGADINGSNDGYDHWSPLMLSIHWKQPEMQQELLSRGARVGLLEALLFGDDPLVEQMLRPGRSALVPPRPNGGSILALARTPFAIDRLLELGAQRDLQDRWGSSPIDALSRLGPAGQPLVRHLLAHGLEAGPAEYARMGDRDGLQRLIDADPAVLRSGDVLSNAVGFGHHELVQWLLTLGADPNAIAKSGEATALHSAAWEGDLRMVRMLVAAGADVKAREKGHNATPAAWARAALEATNNPACQAVADYLDAL